ncbi:hypothetical protein FRC03_008466 [Tulasnella sp. 419]|nr:hypothetical protein FRC03_008466 [Tulasnella sp. 419]
MNQSGFRFAPLLYRSEDGFVRSGADAVAEGAGVLTTGGGVAGAVTAPLPDLGRFLYQEPITPVFSPII